MRPEVLASGQAAESIVVTAPEGTVDGAGARQDAGDEKVLERRLRQAEKMEAIGRLAGGVAHDFNNLLSVITGYVSLALQDAALRGPARSNLETALSAADRAAHLTRQLLAFSRHQALETTVLDVNVLVRESQPMLQRLVREDIELVTRLAPRLGRVRADAGQIEQILLNLAANARDAMPDGGTLRIETADVQLDDAYAAGHASVRPGPYVMLAVSDDGQGIAPEIQPHIFEPFYTTKAPGKGTGLGLATVYGAVRQSGGDVQVSSEPGVGTTFRVYLPRVDDDASIGQPVRAAAARPAGGEETVLLVEDEPMLRELLRETLQGSGYCVLLARDGTEALQVADERSGAIQLLVSDVVMPGFTGWQLAQQLAPSRPEMKVLLVSGYFDGGSLPRELRPRSAFLAKPFAPETLLRKVRDLLDS